MLTIPYVLLRTCQIKGGPMQGNIINGMRVAQLKEASGVLTISCTISKGY
jgi:hypothetical protein